MFIFAVLLLKHYKPHTHNTLEAYFREFRLRMSLMSTRLQNLQHKPTFSLHQLYLNVCIPTSKLMSQHANARKNVHTRRSVFIHTIFITCISSLTGMLYARYRSFRLQINLINIIGTELSVTFGSKKSAAACTKHITSHFRQYD